MKQSNLKRTDHAVFSAVRRSLPYFIIALSVAFLTSFSSNAQSLNPAEKPAAELEKLPRVKVPEGPFLFINREEIASARNLVEKEPWAKTIKDNYLKTADVWLGRDYNFVQKIIPEKGSIYIYGLGLDLDPVDQKKMKWRGWDDPRHVVATNGTVYPNETYRDAGNGWKDSKGNSYYFTALANGMTINRLEVTELPALVN